MTGETEERLKTLLAEASDYLPDVHVRKMFGCYAFFARDHIYGLVWPHDGGRIGLKIPEQSLYDDLMAQPGSIPWSPGGAGKMGWWVLVPTAFHDDRETLLKWVEIAHDFAKNAPPKPKRNKSSSRK